MSPHAAPAGSHTEIIEAWWFGDVDPQQSQRGAARSLAAALGTATGLKPFPLVLARVMEALADPDQPRARVAALIERDPALVSRLLRVANSALYAPARACSTISDAVMRLGSRNVSDLVAGIAVFGMFADVDGLGQRVRDHCAGVAATARLLGLEWRSEGSDHAFLSGLMHDVGKLLMMQAGAPRYDLFEPELWSEPDRVHLREREVTGYDHSVLGAHVMRAWHIPDAVAEVVAFHHEPGRAFASGGELGLTVALVRLADQIEHAADAEKPLPSFLEQLGHDESAQYASFSPAVLEGMWNKLRCVRNETLAALK